MNNIIEIKKEILVEEFDLSGINKPETAMEKMGCFWSAEQYDIKIAKTDILTQDLINISTHKAIVRSDNNAILGVMGKDYNPTELVVYFSQFDTLVRKLDLKYDKGLIYNGGKKLILKAKFPKKMLVRVGDECQNELNWGTSFDGTMGNNGWLSILRLVCLNGMTKKSKFKQFTCKHTKNSDINIPQKMELLLQSNKYFQEFLDCSKRLSEIKADKMMVNNFIKSIFGEKTLQIKTNKKDYSTQIKNQISDVKGLFENGKGNGQGTAWDLYNGYTEFVDHYRQNDEQMRLVSSTIGDGANKKEKALTNLLTMV